MSYTPNFSDPRVVKRIKQALGFACGVMSHTKGHPWSTRYIDKYFGQGQLPLSKWLRSTLLITTKEVWSKDEGKCKEYMLNPKGVEYVKEVLGLAQTNITPIVLDVAKQSFEKELTSGQFPYKDASNRLWHPLQRYRKQHRKQTLKDYGYTHQYDIECCAPTLIYQYAVRCGMDEYPLALNQYLKDRTAIRQQLALDADIPIEAAKEIINALFAGAVISKNDSTDIYKILNGDIARIEYLKQDPFLTELRNDIKTCWEYIIPFLPRRKNAKTNRLLPIRSKQKWNVYFELERCVLNSVRSYLTAKSNRHFLIHDGWICEFDIDRDELIDFVRDQTGYVIKIEYEKID